METIMKHTGSCASDMPIQYEIDEENRLVTITADFLDTSLLTNFVVEIIGDKHGIEVIADDNDLNFAPDETQQPKPWEANYTRVRVRTKKENMYKIVFSLGGLKFDVKAHTLTYGAITLVLHLIVIGQS